MRRLWCYSARVDDEKWLTIAQNIQAELARRNMTRTQLAHHLGMGPSALRRRMYGRTDWTYAELVDTGRAFGMTVNQLTSGSVGGAAPTQQEEMR